MARAGSGGTRDVLCSSVWCLTPWSWRLDCRRTFGLRCRPSSTASSTKPERWALPFAARAPMKRMLLGGLLMWLASPGCADVDRDLPPEYRRLAVPDAHLASAEAV